MITRIIQAILCTVTFAAAEDTSLANRISQRSFPAVFQAWNDATPTATTDATSMRALHDLVFLHPSAMGLNSTTTNEGMALEFAPADIAQAQKKRATLLAKNPQLILLAEIRYRDAPPGFLPDDAPWWKRDADGKFVIGWPEGGYRLLDVAHVDWQAQVAKRAKAVMDTGVFDGVMLDWWTDDDSRLDLIRRIRDRIGKDALVLVNSNDKPIPQTAEYVNGLYMECYRTQSADDWKRISETLGWAEQKLRTPRVNCLETWFHQSRLDLHLMRAVTTLTLTQSDGYCLFADPNDLPTPDHLHDWYAFWDKGLGRPLKPNMKRTDGGWQREFTSGTVVHNPAGGTNIIVHFDEPRQSRATRLTSTEHRIHANDGDIFLHR